MSSGTAMPDAVSAYLAQMAQALAFDTRYARQVCDELHEHLLACPTPAALAEQFGAPALLAAGFADVYIVRQLKRLSAWLILVAAVGLGLHLLASGVGGGLLLVAGLLMLGANVALARVRGSRRPVLGQRLALCTPMLAMTSATLLLCAALLLGEPGVWGGLLATLLLGRLLRHRQQTLKMCSLWQAAGRLSV